MAYNGTTFDLTATRLTDPATATLTFTKYEAGDFAFTLSSRIYTESITITVATVIGFNNTTCTLPSIDSDSIDGVAIVSAGTIGTIQTGQLPFDCTFLRYKRGSSISVNGISRTDGQTLTVGGTTVTVVIDSTTCVTYAC